MSFLLFSSVPSLSSYHKSTSLYQYSLIILSQSAQEAKHFVFLRKIFVLVTKTRKILCVFSLFFRVSFRARDVAERPVDVRFATTGAERRPRTFESCGIGNTKIISTCTLLLIRARDVAECPVDIRFATTGAERRPRTFEPRRGLENTKKMVSGWIPSFCVSFRARDGTRTRGLDLGKVALHQLSHSRKERVMGIEPTYPAWKAGVLPLNYTRRLFNCCCLVKTCL